MAATSDEEMEKLLSLADQISDDFRNGIDEIQTLKSKLDAEEKNRHVLELTCDNLKGENERLKTMRFEFLHNLANQLQQRGESRGLREELMRLSEEFIRKEEEHRREVESIKRSCDEKIRDLKSQFRAISNHKAADEAAIYQLHHELISCSNRLKDAELKYQVDIDDLRDCICAEQQEKEELSKKVRGLEKELLITRTKKADQHGSSSDKQLDAMKQKMMKLRKENEVLKRQLLASEVQGK